MRAFVVTPPQPVVTWEDADAHLKLDGDTDQKDYVEALIAAATGHLDGPEGWLGRAIGVQTIEARFDLISYCRRVPLPFPPIIELVSVKYLDANEVEHTADLDDFELLGSDLVPLGSCFVWEGGSIRREAARVQYRAGYETLPPAIRAAILIMVGDLYANRESMVVGATVSAALTSVPATSLLRPFRVFR